MRKLMWFTIGFAAACAAAAYLHIGIWVCALVIGAAVALFAIKKPKATVFAIILTGLTVGLVWFEGYNLFYLNNAKKLDGKTVREEIQITDYGYETDFGVAADGTLKRNGKNYNVRVYLSKKTELQPGDTVVGSLRFRLTTSDSLRGETYHQGDGIFLLAYADEEAEVQKAQQNTVWHFPSKLRHKILTVMTEVFPDDTLGFAAALCLGDSSLLEYETDTDFKLSGIRHIIAVSGLHVSILMTVVYLCCGRNRYLSGLIGIPLLILFAAVVGFTPSVVRACIMQILILVALFFNQEYDPPTSLAFAALVMLVVNPLTIISVSFQLSCGCLVGIFLFYERINGYIVGKMRIPKGKTWKGKILRGISASVAISLSTMITTTPLCAIYFGSVSIVSVLTNLLTLWTISFLFCGIGATCFLGMFWIAGAKVAAMIVSLPARFVLWVAKLLAGLPFSAVYTCSIYVVVWLVLCYVLLAVFLLHKKRRPMLLLSVAIISLVCAIGLSWLEPRLDNYRVTFIDVGQGQSILIQCDDGNYLIDCGGDSDRVAADTVFQRLLSMGITHLDGVLVTHYDSDHVGGIPLLLTSVPTDMLYLPDVPDSGTMREALTQCVQNICWVQSAKTFAFDSLRMTLVPGRHKTSENETAMCILFQIENCDILITGDRSEKGERQLLQDVELPEVDILVAGHHGAATSTGLELLSAVKPKIAVISAGKNNLYGHPSEEVLRRLKIFGCAIWRTDLDGTIIYKG